MGESYCVVCKRNKLNEKWICTLGVFLALAFVADFPPVAPEFHQRTHRVRLKNLGTTDKKSSHEIKHKKIPRVHLLYVLVLTELKIMITFLRKL